MTTSEALYNSIDRAVEVKLEVYFDEEPLVITRSNYLVDFTLLEETMADSDTYIGTPSANEVSATLYSENGIFSVLDTSSPLYGKIRAGVEVRAFIRILSDDEYDWDALGVFYISDWSSDITGVTACLTASDKLAECLTDNVTVLDVVRNISYRQYLLMFFQQKQISVTTKSYADYNMQYGYIDDGDAAFLSAMSYASQLLIYCNHAGVVELRSIAANIGVATHTINDHNQIISASAKQSIVVDYSSTFVATYLTEVSDIDTVIELNDIAISNGDTIRYTNMRFSNVPLYNFVAMHVLHDTLLQAHIENVTVTPTSISFDLVCTQGSGVVSLVGYGRYIRTSNNEVQDDASVHKINNKYVEDFSRANALAAINDAYIQASFSTVELEVRGNPYLCLGDLVNVVSDAFSLNFTGIIVRQEYRYDGGLTAKLAVLKVL